MTPPKLQFAPELMAEARRLYEDTMTPAHEIAAMMGISTATLRNRLKEWNWTRRRHPTRALDLVQAVRGATVAAVTAPGVPDGTAVPMTQERREQLAARILDIVERQMDATERVLKTVDPKDQGEGERSTRVLTSIGLMLRETAALLQPDQTGTPDAADDDSVPADLDQFREALARRIEAFIDARRGGTAGADGASVADVHGEGT